MQSSGLQRRVISLLAATAIILGTQIATAKDAPLQRQQVYAKDKNVVSPSLITPLEPFAAPKNCDGDYNGNIQFSLIVDPEGNPRNIMFEKPTGSKLDILALEVVQADRFVPGSIHGTPVAVAQLVKVAVHACLLDRVGSDGKPHTTLNLESRPQQEFSDSNSPSSEIALNPPSIPLDTKKIQYSFGGKISQPVAFIPARDVYLDDKSPVRKEGTEIVGLIVDEHGLPQDIHVIQSFDAGIDVKGLQIVEKQRFRPAMSEGRPIPMKLAIEIKFRLYHPR